MRRIMKSITSFKFVVLVSIIALALAAVGIAAAITATTTDITLFRGVQAQPWEQQDCTDAAGVLSVRGIPKTRMAAASLEMLI